MYVKYCQSGKTRRPAWSVHCTLMYKLNRYAECEQHADPYIYAFMVRFYFFLSILLIMALTSTGAEAAAALAFSSSSCFHRMMGWMPRLRF